jgi:streptogramin lyase
VTGHRRSAELIERELGTWLRDESETRAPVGLVEAVFAQTSRAPQASRWWPPTRAAIAELLGGRTRRLGPLPVERARPSAWRRAPALAGAIAVVLVAVGLALIPGRPSTGPGATISPIPSPTPSTSPTPSVSPPGTSGPEPTTVGSAAALRLFLGPDAAPIDVVEAFGSIWVADIHASDVRRFDPDTMAEIARIPVGSAAWFAEAGGGLWVTSQTGTGLSRIDPATNTLVAHVGDVPPCAAPVIAFDSLWQAACDGGVILRIDPVTNTLLKTFPIDGHRFLVLAGGRLITIGSEGLASFDPDTGAFTPIGGGRAATEAELLMSDGTSVWVKNTAGMARLDPADGTALAAFADPAAGAVSFSGDHAWLTVGRVGVREIDLATNQVRRTIPIQPFPLVPLEAGGALWVTDFEGSLLWRVDL